VSFSIRKSGGKKRWVELSRPLRHSLNKEDRKGKEGIPGATAALQNKKLIKKRTETTQILILQRAEGKRASRAIIAIGGNGRWRGKGVQRMKGTESRGRTNLFNHTVSTIS